MEILLIENVAHLGARGDVVNVKDGYARNYLMPRKMALPVTAGNKRQIELEKLRAEKLRAKELADAKSLAEKLEAVRLTVARKAGDQGHLFGSVTNGDVADLFKAKGFTLDRRDITVPHIKDTGTFTVDVRLYSGVHAKVSLDVTASAE